MTKQHISYSELKIFTECPHKWHLQYEKGLAGFTGNVYTAFGSAIHAVCEQSAWAIYLMKIFQSIST